jgi:hypothetical protein
MKKRQLLAQGQIQDDLLGSLGDIGDLEDLSSLAGALSARDGQRAEVDGAAKGGKDTEGVSKALQRAVEAFSRAGGKKEAKDKRQREAPDVEDYGVRGAADSDDGSLGDGGEESENEGVSDEGERSGGRKRRRAPDDGEGLEGPTGEHSGGFFEEFTRKKKQYNQQKQEHYTIAPRTGGRVEEVEDGARRSASYEIMANRGLRPHRKKANRNPRVKKREAFSKALQARKSQVREVVAGAGSSTAYGGEMTGIKANLSRSRKIGN